MEELRKILVAIDDSDGAQRALQWTLDNFYREGDILALLHVIPRPQTTTSYGAPPVDMLPSSSTVDQEQQAVEAQRFIREKFLPRLQGCADEPEVHIVRVRESRFLTTFPLLSMVSWILALLQLVCCSSVQVSWQLNHQLNNELLYDKIEVTITPKDPYMQKQHCLSFWAIVFQGKLCMQD